MNGQEQQLLEEMIRLKTEMFNTSLEHYLKYELFSVTWWISVGLLLIPLIVWWLLADKRRLLEICVFGLLANIAATFLDVFGSDFVLWEYPTRILPKVPLLLPVDYVIVPVVGMLLYQRFAKWKTFILACTIASAVMSFLCEPLAVLIGMYKLISWRYIYSFPIYILLYVIARLVTEKLVSSQNKQGGGMQAGKAKGPP